MSAERNQPLLAVADEPPLEPAPRVARRILALVPALLISRISWVGMKVTDTALLGHVSTHALSASALSDLWTSATGVFIQGRVLGIFVGNAIGAGHPRLAGEWLQVSYFCLALVALPVVVLWSVTGPVLRHLFGTEESLAHDAGYYALVLMACIPARIAFSQLTQFFGAQKIVRPAAVAGTAGLLLNLGLGLLLVLGVGSFRGFGFTACPIVTSSVEWAQLAVVVGVFCLALRLHRDAWPAGGAGGWSAAHVTRRRVREYLKLYVPAALSIASDFWRFSAVGALAATIGPTDLAVFTAAYRVFWISLTIAGSLAGAIGILLAQHLGAGRPAAARRVVLVGLGVGVAALLAISAAIVLLARQLGAIFSNDEEVLDAFVATRVTLALTCFTMNLAVMLDSVMLTTGRAKTVLFLGLVGSWLGQVPAVFLFTRFWRNDLTACFAGVAAGYALLCGLLLTMVVRSDWAKFAAEAQQRVAAQRDSVEKPAATSATRPDEEAQDVK